MKPSNQIIIIPAYNEDKAIEKVAINANSEKMSKQSAILCSLLDGQVNKMVNRSRIPAGVYRLRHEGCKLISS